MNLRHIDRTYLEHLRKYVVDLEKWAEKALHLLETLSHLGHSPDCRLFTGECVCGLHEIPLIMADFESIFEQMEEA